MGYNCVANNRGSIFIRFAVFGSQICEILQNSRKNSWSSKVLDLGYWTWCQSKAHNATSYWSLIVTLDVSPTVFEILTFNARKWFVFHPSLVWDPRLVEILEFLADIFPANYRDIGYPTMKIAYGNPNFNRVWLRSFWLIHPCDRRTDGQAITYSALIIHVYAIAR